MRCRPDEMADLAARAVVTHADAWLMATIRNAGRSGFSHDTAEITPEQQMAWWMANADTVRAWLFEDPAGDVVGYGLLRPTEDGRWTNSVAVRPSYRGRGYGTAITRYLAHHTPGPLRATTRRDNPAACAMHDADHWQRVPSGHPDLMAFEDRS